MTAQETTNLALRFTSAVSPWWLVVVIPLGGAVVWWIYRRELREIDRQHRLALLALRLALVLTLILLAFRPNLVSERVITFPGRTLFVVDDSPSMSARDDRMSDAEALAIARQLGGPIDEDASPAFAAQQQVLAMQRELLEYHRYASGADRDSDAFWDRTTASQDRLTEALGRIGDHLSVVSVALEASPPRALEQIRRQTETISRSISALYTGPESADRGAIDRTIGELDALRDGLAAAQAELDRRAIAAGHDQLTERAERIRQTPRLERVAQQLAQYEPTAGEQLVSLMTGQPINWPTTAEGLTIQPGVTDLVQSIEQLTAEPGEFPLEAITLITDGQDVMGRPADAMQRTLSRMQAPLLAAGVGQPVEPTDLSITAMTAPPIAVLDQPLPIHLRVKASVGAPTEATVTLTRAGEQILEEQVQLQPTGDQQVTVTMTPKQPGMARYRVRIEPVAGEVIPRENNYADFVLHTRERKVGVLLIDYRPRWQTRFVLNILRRLPYVELNAIILTTQEGGELQRGAQRGTWPDSPAALDMYDLAIVGQLPDDTLTDAERDMLSRWVEDKGRTLVELAAEPVAPIHGLADLALTEHGQAHPMTEALASALPTASTADTGALMVHADSGAPVVTAGFRESGRAAALRSEDLWKALNRDHLEAHAAMVVELVTWSIESGREGDGDAAAPRLDRRRLRAGQSLVVRSETDDDAAPMRLLDPEGQTVAEARRVNDGLVSFDALPPGDFTLARASRAASPTVHVVRDDDELERLALDEARLTALASQTGGAYRPVRQLDRLMLERDPRQRVEQHERVWRLWDSPTLMLLLIVILTVEWVWRKLAGLV